MMARLIRNKLRKLRRRPMPATRCEYVFTADWGYGPLEDVYCREPATHVVKLTFHGYWQDPNEPQGHDARHKTLACTHHASREFFVEDEYVIRVRIYRFRRI